MSQQLELYTETRRDQLERQLAIEANKREIDYRRANGITVIAYWLMKENVCLIYIEDDRTQTATEFPVDNARVQEWFEHPFAHPDANMPIYLQGENDGA